MSKKQKTDTGMNNIILYDNEDHIHKHKFKKENTINNKTLRRTISSYNINLNN